MNKKRDNSGEIKIEIEDLGKQIQEANLPLELREKVELMLARLSRRAENSGYFSEYESFASYIDWVVSLPWVERTEDVLDLGRAKEILNKNHYGLEEIKERILEYMAVLSLKNKRLMESGGIEGLNGLPTSAVLNKDRRIEGTEKVEMTRDFLRAPILLFVGLVGTGKTTLAYSIAEVLGRKFERIPFGGMGDALYLRGEARVHANAEPGQIIKVLRRAETGNPVILLDEIDRVADEARSTIMGVLVELLDPEQNFAFKDHYLDYPFDLSEVLFVATANNTTNISTAVLDRLEIIDMPSYKDEEKMIIAKDYVLPKTMKASGLPEGSLVIENQAWAKIVRPLGFDAGMRSLERTIARLCRKVAKLIIEGKVENVVINEENLKEYLEIW